MNAKFIPYQRTLLRGEELLQKSRNHLQLMESRRTVREFSSEPVPMEVIDNIIMTASTAPSGANKQPWTFCVVTDPAIKSRIRVDAEKEEYEKLSWTHVARMAGRFELFRN